MVDFTILAVTGDIVWLRRMQPDLQALGGTRFVVSGSMEEACDLLDASRARLILLDWNSDGVSCETLDRLLWMNTTLSHPAQVLVVSEPYRADLALTLFQMGVDEYLSLNGARESIPADPDATCSPREPEAGSELEKSLADSDPSIPGWMPRLMPAQDRYRVAGLKVPDDPRSKPAGGPDLPAGRARQVVSGPPAPLEAAARRGTRACGRGGALQAQRSEARLRPRGAGLRYLS